VCVELLKDSVLNIANLVGLSPLVLIVLFVCLSVTCVNFKVLYICRQKAVIYTCFVAAFFSCVAFGVESGVMD
jgi:hypothetical protein